MLDNEEVTTFASHGGLSTSPKQFRLQGQNRNLVGFPASRRLTYLPKQLKIPPEKECSRD